MVEFRSKRSLHGLCMAMALGACSGVPFGEEGTITSAEFGDIDYTGPQAIGGPLSGPVARLFHSDCIAPDGGDGTEFAFLAEALIPIGINLGVNTLGKALSRAGENGAVAIYASLPLGIRREAGKEKGTRGVALEDGDGGTTTDTTPQPNSAPTGLITSGTSGSAFASPAGTAAASGSASTGAAGMNEAEDEGSESLQRSTLTAGECFQFVFGNFAGTADGMVAQTWFDAQMASALGMDAAKFHTGLRNRRIYLSDPAPAFFLEARLVGREGASYLKPTILSYGATLENGASGASRMLLVEYGLNRHDMPMDSDDTSSGMLMIGKVTAGETTLAFHDDDPRLPSMRWFGNSIEAGTTHVNVEMRIVELEKGDAVAAALGTALKEESDRASIADAIRKDLFPTGSDEQAAFDLQIADLTAYQTALGNYDTIYSAAQEAMAKARTDFATDPTRRAQVEAVQQSLIDVARLRVTATAAKAGQRVDPAILQ